MCMYVCGCMATVSELMSFGDPIASLFRFHYLTKAKAGTPREGGSVCAQDFVLRSISVSKTIQRLHNFRKGV